MYKMHNIIKTLLKDSIKIRNLPFYNTLLNHVNFSQDTIATPALKNYKKQTDVLNFSSSDNDPNIISKIIQLSYKDMDVNKALQAMNILKDAVIKDKTLSKRKIKDSKEFLYICQVVQKNVRSLSINNVVWMLHALLTLQVSAKSLLIQTLLQLIRYSLDDLSVGQIILLHDQLKTQEQVPLVRSLCTALPKVFQQRAHFELNEKSNNLIKCLEFSCSIRDPKTKFYIIDLLSRHEELIKPEDLKDIFYALFTLHRFNLSALSLLSIIQNEIKINCESLTFKEIVALLSFVADKVRKGKMEFYSKEMVDALCTAVLNHRVTFRQYMFILKYLNKIRHGNTILLDHLSSKLLDDRYCLEECTTTDADHFIKSCIVADYKPPNWESIQTLLLDFVKSHDYLLNNEATVTFRLLSLGCYCPKLTEKIFITYDTKYIRIINQYTIINVLKLYWCIKFFYPEYAGFMLNNTTLDRSYTYPKAVDPILQECLEMTLGDVKYMKSGLKTKYGEVVDHVIVIQPNGLPMDISNCRTVTNFAEDLDVPSECSKILLFLFPKAAYSINKMKLLSTVLLPLKIIKAMKGHYVICINPYIWENLSDYEKVLHLQQAIKSKCNNVDIPQISDIFKH